MKNTVIFTLLFTLLFSGCKSEKIEGKVKDIHSNPLQGVTVTIEKSKFSSITDKTGSYSVDYAPGQMRLVFSKPEYIPKYLDLNIQQKTYFPAEDIILHSISDEKAITDKAFCASAEADADVIGSTLVLYFAIPSHTELGSIPIVIGPTAGPPKSGGMKDMEFPPLTGSNTAEITGTGMEIIISVTDGSGRCPIEYQKANAGWNGVQGAGVYTKKLE